LVSHRRFHQLRLTKPGPAEHFEQAVGLGLDPALAAGLFDGGLEFAAGKSGGFGLCGRDRQDRSTPAQS
jgi:hypothetical protein